MDDGVHVKKVPYCYCSSLIIYAVVADCVVAAVDHHEAESTKQCTDDIVAAVRHLNCVPPSC